MSGSYQLHPQNLTWSPKMRVWNMFFLFTWVTLRFHVSFPGSISRVITLLFIGVIAQVPFL